MQTNTAQSARKPSKAIWSRHDNMSDQINLQENIAELMNLYLKKKTTKMHIKTTHISKLYTEDTGRFPVISRTGNQYIMVAHYCDVNSIIAVPLKSHKDRDRMVAYNTIMQRLKDRNMLANLQILDMMPARNTRQ